MFIVVFLHVGVLILVTRCGAGSNLDIDTFLFVLAANQLSDGMLSGDTGPKI